MPCPHPRPAGPDGPSTLSRITVGIDRAADVPDLAERWQDLQARADASFFLSWDWIGCWLRETGLSPWLLTARDGGAVVALALLQPAHQRRHLLVPVDALMLHQAGQPDLDSITIEHNGILTDRSCAVAARQACIDHLVGPAARSRGSEPWRWNELRLGGVSSPETFHPLANRAGLMVSYQNYSRSWAVDLDAIRAAGIDYLDGLSANTRYQIRRAIRLYEARGPLAATQAATVPQAMEFFSDMKVLHQRYWTGRGYLGSFASPFFERFHRALLTECVPKGTVELVRVTAGESTIGYVYNLVGGGWVCAYQTGFRYEADPKLKPGLVSHYLCIARHLRQGAARYDFLAGGDRYKASLARPGPDIATLVLQRPVMRLRLERAARDLKHDGIASLLVASAARGARPARATAGQPSRALEKWPDSEQRRQQIARGERSGVRGKVLVLGDDTRSFLAITRSLGRQGIEVHAAPANFGSYSLRSRYISRLHFLPFHMGGGAEWLAAIETLLQAERFDLVIPCDETTLLPMQRNRARLEALTRLAIPGDHAIAVLFDKHATRELARSLGIPVSPGRLPRENETAEMVVAELGAPLVAKPRRSYSTDKLHARGKVRIPADAAALAELLPLDPANWVYEGFVPGRGVGVSLLAHGGRILQVFEHHRVRENVSGSYYRVSAPLTPALEAAVTAIVAALHYTGVGMFEFRVDDASGTFVLLEVNARPWGSMPLPVALGVDFPYFWYRLLVEGVEVPRVAYRTGVYGRNLIPDFWSTVNEARASSSLRRTLTLAATRSAELGRMLLRREVHDVLVPDDPGPGLRELWGTVRETSARAATKLATRRADLRRQARTLRALRRAIEARGTAAELRLLFVCQGNICRSPYAELALRHHLPDHGRIEASSSGMLPMPGRPTPEFGVAAAAARGIDLRSHRSTHLGRSEAESATAILIFDDINRRAILDRYPDLQTPLLRLGDFAPDPLPSIDDPWGHDPATYVGTYDQIDRALEGLVRALGDDANA